MSWTEPPLKRAYPCNGEQLLFFRQQKGWTQKELAVAAGYSERLINKAESGHSISADSINDLAGALTTAENPVFPEDLICDPLVFAKQYIAALYTRQQDMFQAIRHFLDDEIVFLLAGDPTLIPFAGEHRGLANVERVLELFHTVMEVPAGHNHEPHYSYVTQGNVVMVCGDTWIHPAGTPMEKPMRLFNRMKFRKGKLYLFEDVYDTQVGAELFNPDYSSRGIGWWIVPRAGIGFELQGFFRHSNRLGGRRAHAQTARHPGFVACLRGFQATWINFPSPRQCGGASGVCRVRIKARA